MAGGNQIESMKDFRQLKVWQKAHQLTLALYEAPLRFPRTKFMG
jgi:hypothetical protein